jgi:Domain of unknown function (DUF4399)
MITRTIARALAIAVLLAAPACDDSASGTQKTTGGKKPAPSAKTTATASATASAATAEAPKGKVFFVAPLDGAKTFPEVDLAFGAEGRNLTGNRGGKDPHGHAVVIVDGEPVAAGKPMPKDDKHTLFEDTAHGEVKLEPGKHKLTLQFFDHDGNATELSQTINIEVVEGKGERKIAIAEPKDGAKVKGKFKVKFTTENIDVRPAGEAPKEKITGHHHLLVDMGATPVGEEIPNDKTHIHYGKGQTEVEVELAKGKHKITAQFADGSHRSYGEKLSHSIEIEVE